MKVMSDTRILPGLAKAQSSAEFVSSAAKQALLLDDERLSVLAARLVPGQIDVSPIVTAVPPIPICSKKRVDAPGVPKKAASPLKTAFCRCSLN